jgi:hypothetical protein
VRAESLSRVHRHFASCLDDKLAGQKAAVKGTVNGNTVTVDSVAPAK